MVNGKKIVPDIAVWAGLVLAVVATLAALFFTMESASGIWSGTASRYLLGYLVAFISVSLLGRFAFKRSSRLFIALVSIPFFVFCCGILPLLSVTYFIVSAYCLGRLLLYWSFAKERERIYFAYSISLGSAFLLIVFGMLVFTSYNSGKLYFIFLSIPIIVYFLLNRSERFISLRQASAAFSDFATSLNTLSGPRFYGLLFLSVYIASYCLVPTITSDEQALHLALWTQLEENGKFAVDPASMIWSVAPNTVGLIHAIASLMAGADSKGALNLYLFMFTLAGLFAIFKRIKLDKNDSLLLTTLFVSTPLIPLTLVSIQTDLFLGLMLIGAILAVLSLYEHKVLAAIAGLFCGALALSAKLPGILITAPVALVVLVQFFRAKLFSDFIATDWIKLGLILSGALFLAVWPYLKAYFFTGNPVFPLYNSVFESSYIRTTDFRDDRWFHGASLQTFFGLFFNSKSHLEAGNNFVGGFQYFLLAPLAILLALVKRNAKLLVISLFIVVYFAPIFYSLQYLRYFYAVMPLATVLIAIFFLSVTWSRWQKFVATSGIYVIAFLNFSVMPGVCWLFAFSPLSLLDQRTAEKLVNDTIPELAVNKMVNSAKKNAKVFMAFGRPFGATLASYPIYNIDYSYSYYANKKSWETKEDAFNDLTAWGVDFVYWNQAGLYPKRDALTNTLRDLLLLNGRPVFQSGSLVAFKLSDKPFEYSPIFTFERAEQLTSIGAPVMDDSQITIRSGNDVLWSTLDVSAYSAFKYQVEYHCKNEADFYVAQINWDTGTAYYRLLECTKESSTFAEVGLVPPGAKKATLYLSARTNDEVTVTGLSVSAR